MQDARFQEMLDLLESKRDPDVRWKAESANKAWSEFDFCQKKGPSVWITFLALRGLVQGGRLVF